MKHSILITAYKDYEQLVDLIQSLHTSFDIYIHIDKKSTYTKSNIEALKDMEHVRYVIKKYNIFWGGLNHLKSVLLLLTQAVNNNSNGYFHFITAQDYPIKSNAYIVNYFIENKGAEFLDFYDFPRVEGANNGGVDRIVYYNFNDIFNFKKPRGKKNIKRLIALQKKVGFKRKFPKHFPKIYGGSTYWSLSYECSKYVLDYLIKNKSFLRRFKYTLCAEEYVFQTIIMNSKFKENVVNNNLRYIDWVARNGNNPANLDITDYEKLINSNKIFGRKFELPLSLKLLNKIKMNTSNKLY